MPFSHEGAKLLVVDGGGPHTQLATHLAAALGNHRGCDDYDSAIAARQRNRRQKADLNLRFAKLNLIADLCGADHVIQRTAAGEWMPEAIVEEAQRGYDAIFVGLSAVEGEELLDDPVALEVLRDSPAPVVIARYVRALRYHSNASSRRLRGRLLAPRRCRRDVIRTGYRDSSDRALRDGKSGGAVSRHAARHTPGAYWPTDRR